MIPVFYRFIGVDEGRKERFRWKFKGLQNRSGLKGDFCHGISISNYCRSCDYGHVRINHLMTVNHYVLVCEAE